MTLISSKLTHLTVWTLVQRLLRRILWRPQSDRIWDVLQVISLHESLRHDHRWVGKNGAVGKEEGRTAGFVHVL